MKEQIDALRTDAEKGQPAGVDVQARGELIDGGDGDRGGGGGRGDHPAVFPHPAEDQRIEGDGAG